jgi:hypothetical protein
MGIKLEFLPLVCALLFSISCAAAPTPIAEDSAMPHTLPHTSEAVVVQWQTLGGLSMDRSTIADLTIFADGKTIVGPRFSQGLCDESQLDMEQIQDILRFAIDENDFFRIDSSAIHAEIEASKQQRQAASQEIGAIAVPLGPPYVDAGTSVILMAADGQHHEVSVQGLAFAAQDFPEIAALQQLRAIELKLLAVAEDLSHCDGE